MSTKQLYEKTSEGMKEVSPLVAIEDIYSKLSDTPLEALVSLYNHVKCEWKGSVADTRRTVPLFLRRSGLFITYNNGTKYITEFFSAGTDQITTEGWVKDSNWTPVPDEDYISAGVKPGVGTIGYEQLSDNLKQLFREKVNVTNFPDDEDIASVDNMLKLKDREVDAANFQSKGYVILRKNLRLINGVVKNILTQDMINQPNTIYEIRYDFDLNGETIEIQEGCILKFEGGSFRNGVLNGITKMTGNLHGIFKDMKINAEHYLAFVSIDICSDYIDTISNFYNINIDKDIEFKQEFVYIPENRTIKFCGGKILKGVLVTDKHITTIIGAKEGDTLCAGIFVNEKGETINNITFKPINFAKMLGSACYGYYKSFNEETQKIRRQKISHFAPIFAMSEGDYLQGGKLWFHFPYCPEYIKDRELYSDEDRVKYALEWYKSKGLTPLFFRMYFANRILWKELGYTDKLKKDIIDAIARLIRAIDKYNVVNFKWITITNEIMGSDDLEKEKWFFDIQNELQKMFPNHIIYIGMFSGMKTLTHSVNHGIINNSLQTIVLDYYEGLSIKDCRKVSFDSLYNKIYNDLHNFIFVYLNMITGNKIKNLIITETGPSDNIQGLYSPGADGSALEGIVGEPLEEDVNHYGQKLWARVMIQLFKELPIEQLNIFHPLSDDVIDYINKLIY